METISIKVPAALYTSLYMRHGEETTSAITACLSQLLDADSDERSRADTRSLQYPRPGAGTITGKVWEIADRIHRQTGAVSRDAVIKACMEEGINFNTANTQYSHWRKANQ